MPYNFNTYNDPGVYIETITPPVNDTPGLEPTIVALVGTAPTSSVEDETVALSTSSAVALSTLGADPDSIIVKDRNLGTQYVSGVVATVDEGAGGLLTADLTLTVAVLSNLSNLIPATDDFDIQIEDEILTVTAVAGANWTVTRGVWGTTAADHATGQPITFLGHNEVQVLTPSSGTATGGTFTISFDGQTTAAIAYGATAGDIEDALEALSNINPGDVTVAGTIATAITVTFSKATFNGTYLHTPVAQMTASGASLTGPNSPYTFVGTTTLEGEGGYVAGTHKGTLTTTISPTATTLVSTATGGGISANTYIDVEGERMFVSAVSGVSTQTLTVVRGIQGTEAVFHPAVEIYSHGTDVHADYGLSVDAGTNTIFGDGDDITSIFLVDNSRILNNTIVDVHLDYTDDAYYDLTSSSPADLDDIKEKYGDPLDANGNVYSPLTLAAQLAIANGATQLHLLAVEDPASQTEWETAIDKLAAEPTINVIVPLTETTTVHDYVRDHVNNQSRLGNLRRAFFGYDGSGRVSTFYTGRANGYANERISVVAPGQFNFPNGTDNGLVLPGYYAAAAVAGRGSGQSPAEPLTRKQIYGFTGIVDQNSTVDTITMQQEGVLVLWFDRFNRIYVKHGLTTDMTSVYTREISVIAARDTLREFILDTLDSGELIGSPMTAQTPDAVLSVVTGALEEARSQALIYDYQDVKYRLPANQPTTIEIRFAYKPTLPLNYVVVQFSIDTSTATVEFKSINDNPSNI